MMIRDCKENKFKVPVWKQGNNITTVTFPDVAHNRRDKSTDDAVNDAVNDAVKKGEIDAVNDAVSGGLIDVLKAISRSDAGITINELFDNIDKSHRTIQRYIQLLKTLDLIAFKGAAKTGKYYLTAKAERKLKQ